MGKLIDLTGRRFGRLVVRSRHGHLNGVSAWLCECDCGKYHVVRGSSLRYGYTTSCGCSRALDLHGKIFNMLTVIRKAERRTYSKSTGAMWLCLCSCGNYTIVSSQSLRNGTTKTCGCLSAKIIEYGRLLGQASRRIYKNNEERKEAHRNSSLRFNRKSSKELMDGYVKNKINQKFGLSAKDITKEMIDMQRHILKSKRETKKIKENLNGVV